MTNFNINPGFRAAILFNTTKESIGDSVFIALTTQINGRAVKGRAHDIEMAYDSRDPICRTLRQILFI